MSCKAKQSSEFNISTLNKGDLMEVLALTDQEGWTLSQFILSDMFRDEPEGFFAVYSPDGTLLGFIQALQNKQVEDHGHIALFIVKREYRGQGIGKKLLKRAVMQLGDRNISLDAVSGTEPLYARFGIDVVSFQTGILRGIPADELIQCVSASESQVKVVSLQDVSWMDVCRYDAKIHPYPRASYMEKYFQEDSRKTFIAVENGNIVGYICFRPGRNLIEPLYADHPEAALLLLLHVSTCCPGKELRATVPLADKGIVKVMSEFLSGGKNPTAFCTRLYSKYEICLPLDKIYVVLDSTRSIC